MAEIQVAARQTSAPELTEQAVQARARSARLREVLALCRVSSVTSSTALKI
ncbi:hypothetical protein [Pseudomonas syringae]|uniref:hypothetical protein n=1 Tax=Pseudomonas syringae TaxID=317 RepID=UPI0018E5B011|nr:hypothetical protein [Pseudomonas syringae]MBI6721369.1 hypothetical protein [Pseudomonas syringae]MBI6756450.1 hypothetical protein [Pseudomonas syringae]